MFLLKKPFCTLRSVHSSCCVCLYKKYHFSYILEIGLLFHYMSFIFESSMYTVTFLSCFPDSIRHWRFRIVGTACPVTVTVFCMFLFAFTSIYTLNFSFRIRMSCECLCVVLEWSILTSITCVFNCHCQFTVR